jgi:hypothetical protein
MVSDTSNANKSSFFFGFEEFAARLKRSGTAAVDAGLTNIV